MKFADELNAKANAFDKKANDYLSESEFIANRVKQYTADIKSLCTAAAKRGQRSIKGFFVPERTDYNYETTTDGPYLREVPKSLIDKKPYKNPKYGNLISGNRDICDAVINLFDGKSYAKPINYKNFTVDGDMIEKVRVGVLKNLTAEGFKRLQIEHLTGKSYGLKKVLLSEVITVTGTSHYLYLDIAW